MPDLPLSSTPTIYVAVAACILVLGGLVAVVKATRSGLTELRGQIREDYGSEAFRAAVAGAMDSRAVTAPIEKIVTEAVQRSVASSFDHLTTSVRDLSNEQRKQAARLASVEGKVEGILGRVQAQRRGDLPGDAA
jgi:hypothetical protein